MNSSTYVRSSWPTLLLIPGMQCTVDMFTGMSATLHQRLPGLDLRTYQLTASTLDDAAREVADQLDRPAVLVGHSLGGTVALATARQRPELVAGLVCLCANPRRPVPDQTDGWQHLRARTRQAGLPAAEPTVARWLGQRPADDGAAVRHDRIGRRCRRMIAQVGADGLIAQLGVQLSRIDERAALAEFDGPVLSVAADDDVLVQPGVAAEIADAARSGRFARVPGDHLAPMTNPGPVAELIGTWLTDEFAAQPAGRP